MPRNMVLGQRLDGCPVTQQQVGRRAAVPIATRRDRTSVEATTRTPAARTPIHQVREKNDDDSYFTRNFRNRDRPLIVVVYIVSGK